jgi:hypothetical protein
MTSERSKWRLVPRVLGLPLGVVITLAALTREAFLKARKRSPEHELAIKHLSVAELGDLLICDRGYAAFWFFALHLAAGIDLCRACREQGVCAEPT